MKYFGKRTKFFKGNFFLKFKFILELGNSLLDIIYLKVSLFFDFIFLFDFKEEIRFHHLNLIIQFIKNEKKNAEKKIIIFEKEDENSLMKNYKLKNIFPYISSILI